jgi:hypothetical protein
VDLDRLCTWTLHGTRVFFFFFEFPRERDTDTDFPLSLVSSSHVHTPPQIYVHSTMHARRSSLSDSADVRGTPHARARAWHGVATECPCQIDCMSAAVKARPAGQWVGTRNWEACERGGASAVCHTAAMRMRAPPPALLRQPAGMAPPRCMVTSERAASSGLAKRTGRASRRGNATRPGKVALR